MASKTYIDAFDPEGKSRNVCKTCGLCLQQCPVMKMEKEESQADVGDLNCYCPGCYMQLQGPAEMSKITPHYALEEILWAFGDEYPVPLKERAAKQTGLLIEKMRTSFTG